MANAERNKRRQAALRVHAGEILSRDGNRLALIEALSVCLLFVALYTTLNYCFAALSLLCDPILIGALFGVVVYLTVRLLVAPTVLGLFYMAMQMSGGEEAVLADLFHYLGTGKRYRHALRASRPIVYLLTVVIVGIELTYTAFAMLLPPTLAHLLLCALVIAVEIVGCFLLAVRTYPRFAVAVRNETFLAQDVKREARRTCPAPVRRGCRFFGGFLAWGLLGLLTVGVLLIADTLPRMLVAYCLDCRADNEL